MTGDESADVVDDKLIETAADFVKQNGVMANQIEVCTSCMVHLYDGLHQHNGGP